MSSKVAGNTRDKAMIIRLITTVAPANGKVGATRTEQNISTSEVDSLLASLGLTFISANTLPRFIERSAGNRLSVEADNVVYAFTQVPANER